MFQRLALAAMTAATVFTLAACKDDAASGGDTSAPQSQTISGTVSYRERMALPPTAQVQVSLVDVSLADAPSKTIAEATFATDGNNVPLPFKLSYDPAQIEPRHSYALQARITDQGELLFITDTRNAVLDGGEDKTDLMLVRVN